jgi:SP family facilitated glucose transporter-like MFS transporter 8
MHFNLQFAIFGSILTIGAMVGAVTSGRLADFLGRKMVKLLHCQFRPIFLFFLKKNQFSYFYLLKIIVSLYPLF